MRMTDVFGINSEYLTKNGKPWFPVMGEMHYSRYPNQYWKESLYKMKAGKVEIVSSYTIWIHHEEIEGEFDFGGDRSLRTFIQACKECGLYLFLRIGPWAHAEARNGGFPDWLLEKGFRVRHNDPGYLEYVKRFFQKLYEQAEGYFLKDGGPIIGLQIENELGHAGGAEGEEGNDHIRTLYQMAVEIGFDVPYYTATGWGGAAFGDLIPVMGGYPDAPWEQTTKELEPSNNFVFSNERNDHNIASDYNLGKVCHTDFSKYPYLTAELGGGMQPTHHRRTLTEPEDIGAMTLTKLGSGVNLLGYYMYHGGTNPKGKLTSLQESRATGSPNDYTECSYEFRAPIREYGQISDTFREIKLYSMFTRDFGSGLCTMPAYIPEDNPESPKNQEDLRYSIRHNGKSGYLFVNNYQRRYPMKEHQNVNLSIPLPNETITFPSFSLKDKDYFFLPFNMPIGNAVLKTAMVTPLCILNNAASTYVFYGDRDPRFDLQGDPQDVKLLTISRADARNAWKVIREKEHLIISEAAVVETDQGLEFIGRDQFRIKVYPDFDVVPEGWEKKGSDGEMTLYEKSVRKLSISAAASLIEVQENRNIYEIDLKVPREAQDCYLQIDYKGDQARLYQNGEFIADHYYTGKQWEIGLKRFQYPTRLILEVYPLRKDDPVYIEEWPVIEGDAVCEVDRVALKIEYRTVILV